MAAAGISRRCGPTTRKCSPTAFISEVGRAPLGSARRSRWRSSASIVEQGVARGDLSSDEWAVLAPLLPAQPVRGRQCMRVSGGPGAVSPRRSAPWPTAGAGPWRRGSHRARPRTLSSSSRCWIKSGWPHPDPGGREASKLVNRRSGVLVTGKPEGAAGQTHYHDDPQPRDQIANRLLMGRNGARPPASDPGAYKERNQVERGFNRRKH